MINEIGLIPLFVDKQADSKNDVQGHTTGKWKAST